MSHNQAILCEKEYEVEVIDTVVRKFRTRAVSQDAAQEKISGLVDCLTELPEGTLDERDYQAFAVRNGSETTVDFNVDVVGKFRCCFRKQSLNVAGAADNWEEEAGAEDFRNRFVQGDVDKPDYFWYDFEIEAEACEYKGVETTRYCNGDKEFQRAMLLSLREWIDKELQTTRTAAD